MSRELALISFLLTGTLGLGCSDPARLAAPAGVAGVSLPSFRTDQSPEASGAVVIHDQQGAFFYFDSNPPPGLTLLIGWTSEELKRFCAAGEVTVGSLAELLVFRPDGSVHRNVHGSQIPLLVWEGVEPDLCAALEVPHLTGTGQFTSTDNDVFTTGNRADAFHYGIHGKVASEAGERFLFSGQIYGVILRSGEQHFTSDLQLKPFGR
jgi:hypothetical protein